MYLIMHIKTDKVSVFDHIVSTNVILAILDEGDTVLKY